MFDELAWRLLKGVGQLGVINHRCWTMRMTTRDEVGGGYEELEQVERVVEREFAVVVVGIEAGAGIEVEVEAEVASGLERDTSSNPMAEPDAGTWIEGVY